ncbi:hypothetical protein THF5H11_40309 [Vibrio jasicida]|nr:hypothetical protein THF5H11_40309 [Vibrio jasicida]CAH1607964.1 hypothetical protein THF5G08_50177 [Vibrio jasicida]
MLKVKLIYQISPTSESNRSEIRIKDQWNHKKNPTQITYHIHPTHNMVTMKSI